MADEFIQVTTTLPDQESAHRVAKFLVERRLAACVQVSGPIRSTFRWQGQLESVDEFQCVAKVRASQFDEVAETIKEFHPYDVPELIAVPLTHMAASYREWMDQELP